MRAWLGRRGCLTSCLSEFFNLIYFDVLIFSPSPLQVRRERLARPNPQIVWETQRSARRSLRHQDLGGVALPAHVEYRSLRSESSEHIDDEEWQCEAHGLWGVVEFEGDGEGEGCGCERAIWEWEWGRPEWGTAWKCGWDAKLDGSRGDQVERSVDKV